MSDPSVVKTAKAVNPPVNSCTVYRVQLASATRKFVKMGAFVLWLRLQDKSATCEVQTVLQMDVDMGGD